MPGVIETLTNKGKLVNRLDCDEVGGLSGSLPPTIFTPQTEFQDPQAANRLISKAVAMMEIGLRSRRTLTALSLKYLHGATRPRPCSEKSAWWDAFVNLVSPDYSRSPCESYSSQHLEIRGRHFRDARICNKIGTSLALSKRCPCGP